MTDDAREIQPDSQDEPIQDELFPIREVARLTGVNPITLRAWERRYALIRPTRTLSGHRLYSLADVERVRWIQTWIQRGVPVGKVSAILARTRGPDLAQSLGRYPAETSLAFWHNRLQQALERFDTQALDSLYGQLVATWPLAQGFVDVLLPLWQRLQHERDHLGATSQWLFLDGFLRARLQLRLQLAQPQSATPLLVIALPDSCQELELLTAAALLGGDSVRVCVLGLGQPLEELSLVCERLHPAGVVFYAAHSLEPESVRVWLRWAQGLNYPLALLGEAESLAPVCAKAADWVSLGALDAALAQRTRDWLAAENSL